MLEKLKIRLGIPASVTVYDSELSDYIEHAKFDMREGGVSDEMIETAAAPVVNTIAFFTRMIMATDNNEHERYRKMYEGSVFRLSLMTPEEV